MLCLTKVKINPIVTQFMEGMLFGVEPFYVFAWLVAGTVAASGVGWKFLKLINKIDQRGKNQNTALIEMADHSDTETDRLHPERSPHKIKPTIERILKE
jgi:hypothetical protein